MTNYHAHFDYNQVYHIYNWSNGREQIFLEEGHYQFFLKRFSEYVLPYLRVYAYAIMPNHFHFIVGVKCEKEVAVAIELERMVALWVRLDNDLNRFIAERFQRFLSSYAKAFNAQQNRNGSVFQRKYKRVLVKTDSNFTRLLHYVHHNPIHHGLSEEYGDWKYSSYNAMISDQTTLIERAAVLEWFRCAWRLCFICQHRGWFSA